MQVENQQKDLFFHIKDFPHRHIQPRVGEKLKFRISHDNSGKAKAENIIRLDMKVKESSNINTPLTYSKKRIKKNTPSKSFNFWDLLSGVVIVIFFALIVPYISNIYKRQKLKWQTSESVSIVSSASDNVTNSHFSCDGRIHCSQMKSRDEALFFINNCPGTRMDGDGDGDPCESQFR
ncbi:excalibur calcium-binding domain-containing protein [Acinetobacter shaoyimingii]|uniref:excalibur calcium-binding domain-containing protein n=1 Tax=Acinetobacter shaoyimingii TaxID=2715164 RepID=UPI00387832D0